MTTTFDREVRRGDTLYFLTQVFQDAQTKQLLTVPVTNPPTPPPPGCVPFNLTGCTLWYTAKGYPTDPDVRAVFALGSASPLSGVSLVSATVGLVSVTGPASRTLGFPDGPVRLSADLQVRDGGGRVSTVEAGTLTVVPDLTRAT